MIKKSFKTKWYINNKFIINKNKEEISLEEVEVIKVDQENISKYPPKCFLNPKNEGYQIKLKWLQDRFSESLKILLLYLDKKCIGFIEYVPGEYAWRAVDAKDYMFIHCIWITPNKNKEKGYGSLLVKECIKDAEKKGKLGVVVITSEGPFMAGKDLFLKNGFSSVSSAKPSYELMVKNLKKGPKPKFNDFEKKLENYKGLHIVYSNQCPWVARSIDEIKEVADKQGLKLIYDELKTAKDAQNAPSIYGVFTLINNGKILVDHYISTTRFKNIVKKELN